MRKPLSTTAWKRIRGSPPVSGSVDLPNTKQEITLNLYTSIDPKPGNPNHRPQSLKAVRVHEQAGDEPGDVGPSVSDLVARQVAFSSLGLR